MTSSPGKAHANDRPALEVALGYLNFSSGSPDPQFLAAINELFAEAEGFPPYSPEKAHGGWQRVRQQLVDELQRLAGEKSAFGDCEQARAALNLVFDHVLPGYREFHRDLLFHQSEDELFRPLFVGRVCEAVLAQGAPWEERERITHGAIGQLNDYVGYRPVPTLQSHKHEPYAHEWTRPIPLYIEDAGVGVGRYHDVVEIALDIINHTDEEVLVAAQLNPDWLTELAMDPRAYDFDHPANKRPNYHFGQWDPHSIDNSGRYRRLVVQQVTLDALMERVENPPGISADEALYEGGAVLAGVMLMATGICGWGPEAMDSTISLGNLVPHIAAYRDEFYQRLLAAVKGPHGKRLRDEAKRLRQPFAAARQELNAALTRRRATQIAHVELAKVFARMGFDEAARRHADVVPSPAARIACRIDCRLAEAQQAIEKLQLDEAADALDGVEQSLHRGIECGALIDPWNILGFDANFSLFPAIENSIHDIRADDLAALMDQLFQRYTSAWCAAAASNREAVEQRLAEQMERLAQWWHQFAAHEVGSIEAPNGTLAYEAARHVADILRQWHAAGAAGGDIRFWAPHAQQFESPKAYATVVEALLDGGDYVASKALLVHWLSRAEETGLEEGGCSFSALAVRWLRQLQEDERFDAPQEAGDNGVTSRWAMTKHLFDLFEANAETYGQAPQFLLGEQAGGNGQPEDFDEFDDEDDIYEAAYEEVVYRDSTDDGFEGDLFDYGQPSEDELENEAKRISLRLSYLTTVARLWKLAAWCCGAAQQGERSGEAQQGERSGEAQQGERSGEAQQSERSGDASADANAACEECRESLVGWFKQADAILSGLRELLADVAAHRISASGVDCDSLLEFDRQHSIQEAILERVAFAHVEVADAALFLLSAAGAAAETIGAEWDGDVELSDEGRLAVSLTAALMRGDQREAQARCAEYLEAIDGLPLLYIPISRGGNPHELVHVRRRQRTMQNLAFMLPRLGLLREARSVVETARQMERDCPVGPGAVTEFDDLFEIAYRAIIDSILHSSQSWWKDERRRDETAVFALLEHITRPMNKIWDTHSRTLRLSVLERASDEKTWNQIVRFIRSYGGDLFTQHFLNLGNIRAIQQQGVEQWLDETERNTPEDERPKLLRDLGGRLSRRRAVRCLTLILDAIAENYIEYRDYNATRTESDRGEELYKLLDFLRLRVAYDIVAWRYRPVMIAHELLLARGRPQVAELFRRGLAKCTRDEADRFMQGLSELEEKHAMVMPTIAEKIAERFVQPTTVHRLCSLVQPAMEERDQEGEATCFNLLEQEADVMVRECGGVGLDVPAWLLALEEAVERATRPRYDRDEEELLAEVVRQVSLDQEHLEELLDDWTE